MPNTLIHDMKNYSSPFNRLNNIASLPTDEIKSTGYVLDSLEAAFWCFLNTDKYEDCILQAINLGSMAGLCYHVPEKFINQLVRKDYILKICEDFAEIITKDI